MSKCRAPKLQATTKPLPLNAKMKPKPKTFVILVFKVELRCDIRRFVTRRSSAGFRLLQLHIPRLLSLVHLLTDQNQDILQQLCEVSSRGRVMSNLYETCFGQEKIECFKLFPWQKQDLLRNARIVDIQVLRSSVLNLSRGQQDLPNRKRPPILTGQVF